MICVQNSDPSGKRVLVTSDLAGAEDAARETGAWLRTHGYRPLQNARSLLVYENGICVREWMQAERHASYSLDAPQPGRVHASLAALLRAHPPHTA